MTTAPAITHHPPRALIAAAAAAWWQRLDPAPDRPIRSPPQPRPRPLSAAAQGAAAALAERAARLPVDEAIHLLGTSYVALLPPERRRRDGVFYTPPAIVARLLDAAGAAGVDWATCRALDPACGSGAFLAGMARRCLAGGARDPLAQLSDRLRAFELDPFAAWLARVGLDAIVLAHRGHPPDAEWDPIVSVTDALDAPTAAPFDLVAGNPPFGRVRLAPGRRARFGRSLFGHANLYGLFLDLAVRQVRPGGLVALVTPPSFLCGEYFKNLRALLAGEAPPVSLDFLAERAGVFEGVLQETLLAVFRRRDAPPPAAGAGQPAPAATGQPWIVARSPRDRPLVERLAAMPTRLADWGYGVSTGPLVWNRHKDQLRARRGAGDVPLVWAEAVGSDGRFHFRALRPNHAPYLHVELPAQEWLLVSRPCVLVQRTTAKEQARRLIAAELRASFLRAHGPVTVENHLNMVLPRGRPSVPPRTLAAFLNSGAADRAFRCLSGTVAVSAYELESLPLPPAEALAPLTALLGRRHDEREVQDACDVLYGARAGAQ